MVRGRLTWPDKGVILRGARGFRTRETRAKFNAFRCIDAQHGIAQTRGQFVKYRFAPARRNPVNFTRDHPARTVAFCLECFECFRASARRSRGADSRLGPRRLESNPGAPPMECLFPPSERHRAECAGLRAKAGRPGPPQPPGRRFPARSFVRRLGDPERHIWLRRCSRHGTGGIDRPTEHNPASADPR